MLSFVALYSSLVIPPSLPTAGLYSEHKGSGSSGSSFSKRRLVAVVIISFMSLSRTSASLFVLFTSSFAAA